MTEPKTVSNIINKLASQGFSADFKAHKHGIMIFPERIIVAPEDLIVENIYRVEGETDLADETIIFALIEPQRGIKGTYTVAFGPMTLEMDVKVLHCLNKTKTNL